LIESYFDEKEYKKEKNLVDFLNDYINKKDPVEEIFKKYFGVK